MSYYEMLAASGILEQDDPDIPDCENCLKSLDDPTHKCHIEMIKVATGPNPEDFEKEPELICEEPKRVECMGCGEILSPDETIQAKVGCCVEYWCKPCVQLCEQQQPSGDYFVNGGVGG